MGQTGGQNFALCPTHSNRKYPWGKDPTCNVKSTGWGGVGWGGAVVANDWCITKICPCNIQRFLKLKQNENFR